MSLARLIVDPPQPGDWNMAVDEVLLRSAAGGITTLRFYQWREPTLSLGYFQAAAERESHAPSRGCALVRRATGGGAILHHHELTYSYAAPVAGSSGSVRSLYFALHETLIEVLRASGLSPHLSGVDAQVSASPPFLCFHRRTPGDVLLAEGKICGSAQRRSRGAVLQHGSVLFKTSPFAPEIPGIEELGSNRISPNALKDAWLTALARRLGLEHYLGRLTEEEAALAAEVSRQRFGSDAWTHRR